MNEPIKPTTVPSVHDIVHTPGPWEVFQWAEHMPLAGHPSTVGQSDELGLEAQDVCDIVPTDSKATEWANARLIAAAPDLLEACLAFTEADNQCGFNLAFVMAQEAFKKAGIAPKENGGETCDMKNGPCSCGATH